MRTPFDAGRSTLLGLCALPLALAALSGCAMSTDPTSEDTGDQGDDLSGRKGVDYAWARPSPHGLHADGYTFAARYLSYDTSGKNVSKSEADALIAAGVDVVSNWEQSADAALDGYSRGASDAHTAQSEAEKAGMPGDRPIYFSVDFDAQPSQQGAINGYFDGVASVLGRSRTGAYGGYYLIKRLFDAGKIKWGWQAYAWSYGNWDSRAHLRQVQNGVNVAGGDCDLDTAIADDFGQWGHTAPKPPPPAPHQPATSVVSWAPERLDVFVRGTNNALYHKWFDGKWSGFEDLGGALTSEPVAISWGPHRLDVFVRGTDGALYHKWWDGHQWGGFENLGGQLVGTPAVVSWGEDRLDVFVRGTNNALYHKWYDGHHWSSGFENLGGALTSDPVAVSWGTERIDVFVRGTDAALYHKWWNGHQWGGFENLGGALTGNPAVASWAPERLDVLVRGTNDALYHKWFDGHGWSSGFENLGGALSADPQVVSWASGRLDVLVRGTNGALYHKWWDGKHWGGFEDLGGDMTGAPAVASWGSNRIDAFARGTDGALYHKWWNGHQWGGFEDLGGQIE